MLPVVHIGTANPSIVDLKEDIVGICELGYGTVFVEDVFDPAKDERVVFLRRGLVHQDVCGVAGAYIPLFLFRSPFLVFDFTERVSLV